MKPYMGRPRQIVGRPVRYLETPMPKLTCLIDEYHSSDAGDNHRRIDVYEGQTVSVSAEKAAQMLRDFPSWFSAPTPEADSGALDPASHPRRGRPPKTASTK